LQRAVDAPCVKITIARMYAPIRWVEFTNVSRQRFGETETGEWSVEFRRRRISAPPPRLTHTRLRVAGCRRRAFINRCRLWWPAANSVQTPRACSTGAPHNLCPP